MQSAKKNTKDASSVSRTGWAPLIVKLGDGFFIVILWRTFRGNIKMYSRDKCKDSILGKVIRCEYNDGSFAFTDDLGQIAKLSEKLMDTSIIGGGNKFALQLSMLRSKGELGGIAELLTLLGSNSGLEPSREFIKHAISEAKVQNHSLLLNFEP